MESDAPGEQEQKVMQFSLDCTRVLQNAKCGAQEGLCSVQVIADTNSFDTEEINVEIAVEPCRASDLKASQGLR